METWKTPEDPTDVERRRETASRMGEFPRYNAALPPTWDEIHRVHHRRYEEALANA